MKKRYQKPQIKSKKIKFSFFLTQVTLLDQFSFMGNVYAQYGGYSEGGYTSWASTNTGDCGSSASPDCN